MSDLEKLVNDIGFQVGLLANQLEEEKSFLSELQMKFQSISKETQAKRDAKAALEEEIKRLEEAYFRETNACVELEDTLGAIKKQNHYLVSALDEIKKSNERLRQERMNFVSECRSKLKAYDEYFSGNEKLKSFIDLWMSKTAQNCQLTDLPDVIRETARKLTPYYESPLEPTLVMAAEIESLNGRQNDSTNSVEPKRFLFDTDGVKENIPRAAVGQLSDTSNLDIDSQMVDSSRLRMSALDTSLLQKDTPNDSIIQNESTMVLDDTKPSADQSSY